MLLIRAFDGHPDEGLNRVYAANAGGALWEVDRGGHTGALDAVPAEYEHRVVGFFDTALLGRALRICGKAAARTALLTDGGGGGRR